MSQAGTQAPLSLALLALDAFGLPSAKHIVAQGKQLSKCERHTEKGWVSQAGTPVPHALALLALDASEPPCVCVMC